MMIKHSKTISLDCPHCETRCQFIQADQSHRYCKSDNLHHIYYICTNCHGGILTRWQSGTSNENHFYNQGNNLNDYFPVVGKWSPKTDLALITNPFVRADFMEAIKCFNNGFYNACMMMARRSIQQEMLAKGAVGENLFQQIESTGISTKLKALLQKVKNFGNNGAHPDFCLYDDQGEKIEDKHGFAALSLEFLDRYFTDEYEIEHLVNNAPKSEKELGN
jgi:hypothetical protein